MRSVVLASGGIDSAVALWSEHAAGRRPTALSVHYGSRHNAAEIAHAARQAKALGVPHRVAFLAGLGDLLASSLRNDP